MLNLKNLVLMPQQISGNATGAGLLLSVAPGYEYVNGKATDTIVCTKYTVVFPENNFEKVVVKVKGNKPVLTNEQIQQTDNPVKISFENLTGRFYRTNFGEYALSCNADRLEVSE